MLLLACPIYTMMRIRTITAGIYLDPGRIEEQLEEAARFLHAAKERFVSSGFEVQTLRLSTQRWETFPLDSMPLGVPEFVADLEGILKKEGIDFLSIGPATTPAAIKMVPALIEATTSTCSSSSVADASGIREANIEQTAETIREVSKIAANGSKGFMFAAIANVPPDTPFFPASYHEDKVPSFSIGLESGAVVDQAARRTRSLREFTRLLGHIYNERLKEIEGIADSLPKDLKYRGVDASFAPGLEEGSSIALSIDRLIGACFGSLGTLSACSAITSSLDMIDVKKCGYSGLMLPVLEDIGLASGADIGSFDIQKLLLYSSVCGTGLDAVPVPGDTPISRISAAIRDVASMSMKLKKPLSARLLPIPNKNAGDRTDLGSPYLLDCSILSLI
ncbi:MAG: DUF711 family protein [Candidatus Thermoplasmatota archaeon]|nr:DUF711 family protein [Candidatus Thermoplasmatota archaeon]